MQIKNILVIRTDRIGEVLLTMPILTALKEKWPEARVSMMIRSEVRELVEDNPNVDEIVEYKPGGHSCAKSPKGESRNPEQSGMDTRFRGYDIYKGKEGILGAIKLRPLQKSLSSRSHPEERRQPRRRISAVATVKNTKTGFFNGLKLANFFRSKNFDIAVIVNPKKKFHLAAFLAGIPIRVGFDRKWGFLLTHKVKDLKFLAERHEVEYNLDLVRALGIEPKDKRPVLVVRDGDRHRADGKLVDGVSSHLPLIAIHPCTSNPKKQWPIGNFAKLSDLLMEKGYNIVMISGLNEACFVADVISMMRNKPINLAGKLTLKELAALFKRCKFLVSGDSGPVHIAAAVGTPVVALFGREDPGSRPKRWGPYGIGHIVIQKDKLQGITPEEVLKVIKV